MACDTNVLGAALRAAGMCSAKPPPRNWVRIDRPDASRAAPGDIVQCRWVTQPKGDSLGRFTHVRSLAVRGNIGLTLGANNDAVSGYQLRSVLGEMDLQDVSGHKYWAALDARNVIDDHFFRHYRLPRPMTGAIAANLGAGDITRPFDIEMPLVSRAPGASQFEGLIPIAALQSASSEAWQFLLRDAIRGAPAGITVNGFTRPDGSAGLELWAELVQMDGVVADATWMLRCYTLEGTNQVLQRPSSKTQYAHVRYYPEDDFGVPGVTGQELAAGISGLTIDNAGMTYLKSLLAVDLQVRADELLAEGVTLTGDSALALDLPTLALPAEAAVTVPAIYAVPWRPEADSPAGPVIIDMSTQPATSTRWLHRTIGCDTEERAQAIVAAVKCGVCQVYQPGAATPGITDAAAPKLYVKP